MAGSQQANQSDGERVEHMKKSVLVLLTFVPIVVGYLVNRLLFAPVIGTGCFLILPLLTTAFWVYLGFQYARSTWKVIPAIFIGNATGILSLLIYIWQMVLETDETRNTALTVLSQMFSGAVPTYLLGRLAILFEVEPNYIGERSMIALQVLSVAYMMVVFLCGYVFGKISKRAAMKQGAV